MERRKLRAIGGIGLLALALCALAAPNVRAQLARWTIDRAAAERGQQEFVSTCAFCHGSDARGSERAPDLIKSDLVNQDEHGELIAEVVIKGRADRGMPAFPALADKTGDIANFLHSRISAVMNRFGYHIEAGATGDARAGERYFNGAGGCKACHSPTGDFAHIGSKYKPDVLLGAIAYPGPTVLYYIGLKMRPVSLVPVSVTVTLPSGRSVSGTAVHVGEYEVSLRDGDGVYRSFDRAEGVKIEVKDPLDAHLKLLARYSDADLHNLLAYLMELK